MLLHIPYPYFFKKSMYNYLRPEAEPPPEKEREPPDVPPDDLIVGPPEEDLI